MKQRALISVSDKTNIETLAKQLVDMNFEILSTGGTAEAIRQAGIDVIELDDITGFPESLAGRGSTLHPTFHGGSLATDNVEHQARLEEYDIQNIDLVVVNLYPFQETLGKEDATEEDMIENIDIGGPAMLRAAAKNHTRVTVIVEPEDYERVIAELQENDGVTTLDTRDRKSVV